MKLSLAARSMVLFVVGVIILAATTAAESSVGVMSFTTQLIVTFFGLVLPAAIGLVFGVMSFVRKEGRPFLASAGILLNAAFGLFHLMIILLGA